ncbi:MAG TPA: crossover junction endodeoxyribonuclease RuvC [Actinomycetota bacterium]|nr:crossover junction endodeoxyribonuclease RuvC [Actinomycetota bacterium]
MRVLGLDPGLTSAGYGVVEDGRELAAVAFGAIRTPQGPVPERLLSLHARLTELLAEHSPDAVAVERVVFNANVRTAMSVGQAAGVAFLAAAQRGCEIAEYAAGEVKVAVCGDGSAGKRQVQEMVARLLRLQQAPSPPDAADALGLAITHLRTRRMRSLEKRTARA